jgi:hypothetical protein
MLTSEYWKTSGKNLITQSIEFIKEFPEFVKMLSPGMMGERLAQSIIPLPGQEKQEVKGQTIAPLKVLVDLALFVPRTLKSLYDDPIGTVRDKPLDTLMLISIFAGPKIKAKIKGGELLSKGDLTQAFNSIKETFPDFKVTLEMTDSPAMQNLAGQFKEISGTVSEPGKRIAPMPGYEGVELPPRIETPAAPEIQPKIPPTPAQVVEQITKQKEIPGAKAMRLRKKLTDRYLDENINYGGETISRGEAIERLRKQGAPQKQIDAYMMGAKTISPTEPALKEPWKEPERLGFDTRPGVITGIPKEEAPIPEIPEPKYIGESKIKLVSPKEQKAWLLKKVEDALQVAPDRMNWKGETITFDVPGDGQFEIYNTDKALTYFKKLAEQWPVSRLHPTPPRMESLKPLPPEKLRIALGSTMEEELAQERLRISRGEKLKRIYTTTEQKIKESMHPDYVLRIGKTPRGFQIERKFGEKWEPPRSIPGIAQTKWGSKDITYSNLWKTRAGAEPHFQETRQRMIWDYEHALQRAKEERRLVEEPTHPIVSPNIPKEKFSAPITSADILEGDTVYHPKTFEPLKVMDTSDPGLFEVKSPAGARFKIGKKAVLLEKPGVEVEKLPPGVASDLADEMAVNALRKIGTEEIAKASKPRVGRKGEARGLTIKFLNPEEAAKIEQAIADRNAGRPETPGTEGVIPDSPAVTKILAVLGETKRLRGTQEKLYTEELGQRMARALSAKEGLTGKAAFEAKLAQFSGKMRKVKFEPLEEKLTSAEWDDLFNQVDNSPLLTEWEKLPAGEGVRGLMRGNLPQEKQLILMSRVYGPEFTKAIIKKWDTWKRITEGALQAAGTPRAIMASTDLSAPLRQGLFLGPRYPKEFFKAFSKQFKYFASEKAFRASFEEIAKRPTFKLMRQNRLALTEMDSILRLREERFMSNWAEKIPLVRASGRAYTGFLNQLRADVFDHLVHAAEKAGLDPWKDARLTDSIAKFVNSGSGRGSLGMFERSAVLLNQAFFSPRLMASRFNLLSPRYYYKLHPFVRKQALQSLIAFTGAGLTTLALAKAGGLEVGSNPFSPDFGKIKIGNTRIDIWGGFQQYVRTAAQLFGGKTVSATTGKEHRVGEGYPKLTYPTIALRFFQAKEAPIVSFASGLATAETIMGEPFSLGKEVAQRFIPMVIQDAIDIYKDDPKLLPVSAFGVFGVGLQTYKYTPKYKKVKW